MARTVAALPAGTRVMDYVSFGVLAKMDPRSQIDAVLAATGRGSRRQRDLPAHVVVYYVIALALYMQSSSREVLRCMCEGVEWIWGPAAVRIAGKCPDVAALDTLALEARAIYLMDRGYADFARLHRFTEEAAFCVTRTKKGIQFTRRSSRRPVDFTTGVLSDHVVVLATNESRGHYPQPLRRVRYVNPKTKKRLIFLTGNFTLPAVTIAHLYKTRWQVETYASHWTSFAA